MPALPGIIESSYPFKEPQDHYKHATDSGKRTSGTAESLRDKTSGVDPDRFDGMSIERTEFPNPWFRFRYRYNLREYFAEFLGTMLVSRRSEEARGWG